MSERADLGLRVVGVLAGIGVVLPVGLFALLALRACPTCDLSQILAGITAALIVATIIVGDGQAWGAAVIGLYAVGMGVRYWLAIAGFPYASTSDSAFVAFHVAIGVVSSVIAVALVRDHASRSVRAGA